MTAALRRSVLPLVVLTATVAGMAVLLWSVLHRAMGYSVFLIVSGSMEPAVPKGSLVLSQQRDREQVAAGDVVTVGSSVSDEPVTHRVVEVEHGDSASTAVLAGDANPGPDAQLYQWDSTVHVYQNHVSGVGEISVLVLVLLVLSAGLVCWSLWVSSYIRELISVHRQLAALGEESAGGRISVDRPAEMETR